MSLARAFTTRRAKQPSVDMGPSPQRSNTISRGHGQTGSIRHKISAPVGLTHTTNMLAYNAPDLFPKFVASPSSSKSDDDSESDAATNSSSPPTSPDVGTTPERTESPEPNHLSCYFMAPGQKPQPGQKLPYSPTPAPSIPKRAPSHTKKASMDNIAAQATSRFSNQSNNSFDTKASSVMSRTASVSTTSTAMSGIAPSQKPAAPSVPATPTFSTPSSARSSSTSRRRTAERPEPAHPFGQELAQVSEIAEEFGIKDKIQITDEEQRELLSKGLQVFAPEVYASEIQSLFASFFEPEQPQSQPGSAPIWI